MNEKTIILVTFASIVLAACTAGIITDGGQAKPAAGSPASGSTSSASPKPSGKGNGDGAKVCTMDAKQCPDGSFVSRNPANNCAFNPCPGEQK